MAGIIGQLTANARKRKEAKPVKSDKSMYSIPKFDRNGFNPSIHNNYVRNRERREAKMDLNSSENQNTREKDLVCWNYDSK